MKLRSLIFHQLNYIQQKINNFLLIFEMEQLKIQLTLHKIKFNNINNNDSNYRIRVSIGDKFFYSAQRKPQKNIVWFNQKNYIHLSQLLDEIQFVTLDIEENGQAKGHKMMFLTDFISEQTNTIQLNIDEDKTIKLEYSMKAVIGNEQNSKLRNFKQLSQIVVKKKKKIDWMKLIFGDRDVQLLNGGQIMYQFAHRLDPVNTITNFIIDFCTWKNPYQTFLIAILISLSLINIRIGLIAAGFIFIFIRKHCMEYIRKWKVPDCNKKITISTKNIVIMQKLMKAHIFIYDWIYEIIGSKDRTKLVCFFDWLTFVLVGIAVSLLVIDLIQLTIIVFWGGLIISSPINYKVISLAVELQSYFKITFPENIRDIIFLDRKKLHKPIHSKKSLVLHNTVYTIVKQFSIFEYDRWWITKWVNVDKKLWSDSTWTAKFSHTQEPPLGWRWIDNWTPVISRDTDLQGFTYANDFDKQFTYNKTVATLRRRQYVRKCILEEQNSVLIKKNYHIFPTPYS